MKIRVRRPKYSIKIGFYFRVCAIFILFGIGVYSLFAWQSEDSFASSVYAAESEFVNNSPASGSVVDRVWFQIVGVWDIALSTAGKIFSGEVFRVTQVGNAFGLELINSGPVPTLSQRSQYGGFIARSDPASGSLVINTPLLVDNTLSVNGEVQLATTTIDGRMTASGGVFDTLVVNDQFTIQSLEVLQNAVVQGVLTSGSLNTEALSVNGAIDAQSLAISQLIQAQTLNVSGEASLGSLQISGQLLTGGLLRALGGIETDGENINLGTGQVFASNLVNEVIAGSNVVITGTRNQPIISFEPDAFEGVLSINGEIGEIELIEGTDIDINGLTIRNTATLSSVRSRGGCVDCITDTDVRADLTISNGSINATAIGLTAPDEARFTDVFIGTTGSSSTSTLLTVNGRVSIGENLVVQGVATSTFLGSIDITEGCYAINGSCIVSASPTTYLSLTDTPGVYSPGYVPYTNASGTALTQSAELVFVNGNLGIGTSTPSSRLTVLGSASVFGQLQVLSSATSTFAGGINVTDGCIAVDGDCLETGVNTLAALSDVDIVAPQFGNLLGYNGSEWSNIATSSFGLGDGTYVGLSDTPSSLTARAIPFIDVGGLALTQAADLLYDGSLSRMGVGTDSLLSTLTVGGEVSVLSSSALRLYDLANAHSVGLRASTTLATTTIWTLPPGDGSANQLLATDGQRNFRFVNISEVGGGVTSYLGLSDTPNSFTPYSIPFVNATGTLLSQANTFVYRNNRLGIGDTDPDSNLTVFGTVKFRSSGTQVGLSYDSSTNRVGIGTSNLVDLLTIQGGSVTQRGGVSGSVYNLPIVSGLSLPDDGNDIEVVGNFAYVVSGQAGTDFHVIDITNPAVPVILASTTLPDTANALSIQGRYAYVVTNVMGDDFHVIDISNPLTPTQVASIGMPTSATAVAVQGRYAYVGTAGSVGNFQVIDISNPLAPVAVASSTLADAVNGIDVVGNYAYAVTSLLGNDFHVIDISDPLVPTEVGWAGLADTANDVVVRGRYAYVVTNSDGNDFHIIDVRNPTSPVEVGWVNLPTAANSVFVSGRYAYVTTNAANEDVHVIDVGSPTAPVEVANVDILAGNVLSVFVSGRYAYVTSGVVGNAFHVVDISGGEFQSTIAHSLSAGSLSVSGNTSITGRLTATLGLQAGQGGVQSDGALTISGNDPSYIAGSLGIGTTTASTSKLSVSGFVRSSELLGGSTSLSTDEYGNIIRTGSDERLKMNIEDIEGALVTVLALRGVQYEWIDKDRFGSQTEIGFLAQEVDALVPQVVRKGGEYWSLNTQNLVAMVVEAIKELWIIVSGNQAKVVELEERIELLEAELNLQYEPRMADSAPPSENQLPSIIEEDEANNQPIDDSQSETNSLPIMATSTDEIELDATVSDIEESQSDEENESEEELLETSEEPLDLDEESLSETFEVSDSITLPTAIELEE